MKYIIMQDKTTGRTVHYAYVVIILHVSEGHLYELIIAKANGGHSRSVDHVLVGKHRIVADYVDLVAFGSMYNVVNSYIAVK